MPTYKMPEKTESKQATSRQPYDKGVSIDVDPTGRLMLVYGDSKVEVTGDTRHALPEFRMNQGPKK